MAKDKAQRARDCRLRKRVRALGDSVTVDISIDGSDAVIEVGELFNMDEEFVQELALPLVTKLYKEESTMLTCWTLNELHNQKMLERQTRLGKRDKAALRGDDNTAEDGTALRIAQELLDLIRSEQPNFMGGAKITAKNWERSIQAMITVDFRDPAEMSAILKYVGDYDRFNIRTILGPRKFREQYDRLAITYNDWVRKGAGVKKLTGKQNSGVNPVNLKSAETILLEQKTAERLEKMRRIEEERSRLTSLTATPPQAEHETADTSTDSTTTPFHPHRKNSQAVRKIRDFLGSFDQGASSN